MPEDMRRRAVKVDGFADAFHCAVIAALGDGCVSITDDITICLCRMKVEQRTEENVRQEQPQIQFVQQYQQPQQYSQQQYTQPPQQYPQQNNAAAPSMQNVVVNVNSNSIVGNQESFFDGKLSQKIGYMILGVLITLFTLGICYPWAVCIQYGWKIKHTVIQGHRLAFDGKATHLFGRWLLWFLLCIVTFGLFSFWVGIALEEWRVKHTHFVK